MEQWAECPPLCISLMAFSGIRPARSNSQPEQSSGVDPNTFHEAASHLGMKRGKPFVPAAEFDRLFQEFTKNGKRRQDRGPANRHN